MSDLRKLLSATVSMLDARGLDTPEVFMLHAHWTTADSIRLTIGIFPEEDVPKDLGDEVPALGLMMTSFYRLLVFYALEYVVIEAYSKLDDRDPELDAILNDGPVDKLRRLRNAVFHVQKEPLNAKLWDFIHEPDSERWVRTLHARFEKFFVARLPIHELTDLARKLQESRASANETAATTDDESSPG